VKFKAARSQVELPVAYSNNQVIQVDGFRSGLRIHDNLMRRYDRPYHDVSGPGVGWKVNHFGRNGSVVGGRFGGQ
jgi:hypothetical protein